MIKIDIDTVLLLINYEYLSSVFLWVGLVQGRVRVPPFYISAGTVDYTGGEEVRANLLRGRSSAKPEAHESLAHG